MIDWCRPRALTGRIRVVTAPAGGIGPTTGSLVASILDRSDARCP